MGFTPEMEQQLARGVVAMQKAVDLPVAFAGVVSGDSRNFVISSLRGTLTTSLANLRVMNGEGLGGKTLQTGQPIFVRDYENASEITTRYRRAVAPEHLRSILSLPIRFAATTMAVVYVGSRSEIELGPRVYERLRPIAGRLAVDLHVESEVERRLGSVVERLPDERPRARLDELVTELHGIIEQTNDEATRQRLRDLLDRRAASPQPGGPDSPISAREAEVLALAERGLRNADIADEIGLRESTVKAYMKSAMAKLGARNRVQAARMAREMNLLR